MEGAAIKLSRIEQRKIFGLFDRLSDSAAALDHAFFVTYDVTLVHADSLETHFQLALWQNSV